MPARKPGYLLTALASAAMLWASPPAASASPISYSVTSKDGVTLAVQESGNPNGPPIIFIHGLLGSRLS